VELGQPIAILAVDDEPGVLALVRRCFEAKQQLWAEEAYLDKPFTREGLREAVALLLFGRTTL